MEFKNVSKDKSEEETKYTRQIVKDTNWKSNQNLKDLNRNEEAWKANPKVNKTNMYSLQMSWTKTIVIILQSHLLNFCSILWNPTQISLIESPERILEPNFKPFAFKKHEHFWYKILCTYITTIYPG